MSNDVRETLVIAVAFFACALSTAASSIAQSFIAKTESDDAIYSNTKFYLHFANGHYWALFDLSRATNPYTALYSSPDGINWANQGEVFTFDPTSGQDEWAPRFENNTVIAIADNYSDNVKYYRKGILNADGTVTWNAAEAPTGPPDASNKPLNALINNGKPIMWRADRTAPGSFWIGDQLDAPVVWTKTATDAPDMSSTTVGGFSSGGIYPTGGADPDDLIVLRATTDDVLTANSHRLVAVKYDASLDSYDASWYNVSTLNGGLPEDDTTRVNVDYDGGIAHRFTAVRDTTGNIHAIYVSEAGDAVHYNKAVGFNDTWSRISDGITGSANVDRVGLTALPGDELMLFYSRDYVGDEEYIYFRTFDGTKWGAERSILKDTPSILENLASIETSSGTVPAVIWEEEPYPNQDIMFSLAVETNYLSIGTNSGILYSTGTATALIDSDWVTFTGACLPFNIGKGDKLTINPGGGNEEVLYILERKDEDELRFQSLTTKDHSAGWDFQIERAFTSIQDWETTQQKNLVTANLREVGVVYNDGDLTGALISGSTTDFYHYMKLTVAESERHNGSAGTGAVVDGLDTINGEIEIQDAYTIVEWLELTGTRGLPGRGAIRVTDTTNVLLRNLLIYNNVNGIRMSGAGNNSFTVRNCIIYGNDLVGIDGDETTDTITVENVTIYGNSSEGINESSGSTFTIKNTISMGHPAGSDFDVSVGTFSNNMSSDETAPGAGSLTGQSAADQFFSITPGSEDFHLRSSADALDKGTDLSSSRFFVDVDAGQRPTGGAWDMGADETMVINCRSIGTDSSVLHSDTSANVSAATYSVTFNGPLPTNIGLGDRLTLDPGGGNEEVLYIESRVSDTEVTVQSPATGNHSGENANIERAYNTLQAWENDRDGNLKGQNRREIGIAYDDGPFNASGSRLLNVNGSVTDASRFMMLTVADQDRHNGIAGSGVVLDGQGITNSAILVSDDYVIIDGLELTGFYELDGYGENIRVGDSRGVLFENLLIHDFQDTGTGTFRGIYGGSSACFSEYTVRNSFIYDGDRDGILVNHANHSVVVQNCTVYQMQDASGRGVNLNSGSLSVTNTVSLDNVSADFNDSTGGIAGSHNMSSDTSAFSVFGNDPNAIQGAVAADEFVVDLPLTSANLHLDPATSQAIDDGTDLSSYFFRDIDRQSRLGLTWDMGADEDGAPTAVELLSFTASGLDGGILLEWETGSELDNLGFHIYRAISEEGPVEQVTASVIPGLGSSPVGASYSYRDTGLTNGRVYYYWLVDIETTGNTELHGPVWAAPHAGASSSGEESSGRTDEDKTSLITYGDPSANSLRILNQARGGVTFELSTEGFYAEPQDDGTVKVEIPGYELTEETGFPSLPVKRTWVEALAGRQVQLVSMTAQGVEAFTSLRPSDAETPEIVANLDGTVRAARSRSQRRLRRTTRADFQGEGLYPSEAARLVSVGFQGDVKKALVELAPLRWDGVRGQLLLARRLVVRLAFQGRDLAERSTDGVRGRRYRRRPSHDARSIVARFATSDKGLYGVSFGEVFGRRGRGVPASQLRLSRQGEAVGFHLEPNTGWFRPGTKLYFLSEGAEANPYGHEAVYELEIGVTGEMMPVSSAAPTGEETFRYWADIEQEENLMYQAVLVNAPDRWLWSLLFAPGTKSFPFEVSALASTGEASRLSVWLQGASDFPANPDHHVRVYVNGSPVGEASWDGKQPLEMEAELLAGLLREGENILEIENVGDTEAGYSMVMLDRFRVRYRRSPIAVAGRLEGSWSESGTVEIVGLGSGSVVLELGDSGPVWLEGAESTAAGLRFRAESGRSYLAVSPEAVLSAEVRRPLTSRLKSSHNGADYLMVGPRVFVEAASELLEHRQSQGLRARGVALEQVYSEFGFGEETPEAIRDFLSYAYHQWTVSPRYMVLLGDATYDFKDYLGTGVVNQVPPLMVKTRYLWTVSDPAYVSVNGEDLLPDLAIGRLPAATVEDARVMVEKIVAYETGTASFAAPVVLVADNPDKAGNFEDDAEELAANVLGSTIPDKIYLRQLGTPATREAIVETFDQGVSLVSYLGHGGIHLWADENLFNISQVDSLAPQPQQPLLLTMTCLNGYFHFPYFNSLAEELVKADGKGAIAAFSPSGLSLNDPAHRFHKALLQELFSGKHARLGDAVLAAQAAYAGMGALPELLSVYHLLGDPALKLKYRDD